MIHTHNQITRRGFIARSAVGTAAVSVVPRQVLGGPVHTPPSEKLSIAGIGFGGRGEGDLHECRNEQITALCDVDWHYAARVFKKYPDAKKYKDYRDLFADMSDKIDAVVIATPDHTHACITMEALRRGKHVYCEKPLTHTVYEAWQIGLAAQNAGVATQLGNQGQASEAARLLCEMIWDGAIGNVREIHGWSNRYPRISPRGIARPKETSKPPDTLDWNLWLGPAPERPYHPAYLPFRWRGWWDFGTGVLGDIGCHNFSAIFKALKLGHPSTVQACSTNYQCPTEIRNETAPLGSMVTFEFPATTERPGVKLTWYDGGMMPTIPDELEPNRKMGGGDGMLYVGDTGKILQHRLIPETQMQAYGKPPQKLERSPGHHAEWIRACKGGPSAGANFVDHAALLTEVVLLGNVALKLNKKLQWNPDKFEFTGAPDANKLLHSTYRNGWTL